MGKATRRGKYFVDVKVVIDLFKEVGLLSRKLRRVGLWKGRDQHKSKVAKNARWGSLSERFELLLTYSMTEPLLT